MEWYMNTTIRYVNLGRGLTWSTPPACGMNPRPASRPIMTLMPMKPSSLVVHSRRAPPPSPSTRIVINNLIVWLSGHSNFQAKLAPPLPRYIHGHGVSMSRVGRTITPGPATVLASHHHANAPLVKPSPSTSPFPSSHSLTVKCYRKLAVAPPRLI